MKNKTFFIVLVTLFLITASNLVYAALIPTEVLLNQNLIITYNNEVQRFKNVNGEIVYPISYEGTTYLPIRSISCLFVTGIEWDGNTNSIYLGKGSLDKISAESIQEFVAGTTQTITASLNQDIKIYYNNEVQIFKDINGKVVYPLSYQGTTYLPVRAISNLYNANIEWDEETSTVAINKKDESISNPPILTRNFKITVKGSFNNIVNYMICPEDSYEYIYIDANDFNLPENLYDYNEDILLEMTYSEPNYNFKSCTVLNASTGEEITDLSEENIKKLFDIEYGKAIIDKPWTGKINLSELKPNEIYRYTATTTTNIPEIINDTGKDCLIYQKDSKSMFSKDRYERKINVYNNIKYNSISFSEFKFGQTLNIGSIILVGVENSNYFLYKNSIYLRPLIKLF